MIESPPERVLILKPCCLGDVMMATPLLASLAAAWPSARIDWAVDEHSRSALRGNPHLSGTLDATGCVRGALQPTRLARLTAAVRRGRYDAAFVPDRSPLLALVPWLGGVPTRVGLDSGGRGWPHSVRVPVPAVRHEVDLYLDLARAIGLPAAPPRPVFVLSPDDRAIALRALAGAPTGGPRVVLHPGGGVNPGMTLLSKRWPTQRFAVLADRLVAERRGVPIVIGGPGDRDLAAAMLREADALTRSRALDLSGQMSLAESAAVVEACDLYVGNDSGMAFMAAAVGTQVVVVFGPSDPRRYGPVPGTGRAVAPATGAVGQLSDGVGSRAIEAISVGAVWSAVEACLAAA